ncbi:hypothetical protein AC578_1991 [Pseudocercospora eumusae]|uniref:DNA polymerase delta subunit 4 n=1 Tax=Pseudocercospora eumusae TaxID=321146 RepID=A0A139HHF8_9PEZI|nr:hypothetical protein AC578_1991 [Pseudocercospora eumusae]
MPPKRRTTTTRSSAPQRQQATLSFHGKNNKVTKAPRSKTTKKDPELVEDLVADEAQSIKAEADPDLSEPTTAEKAIQEQVKSEVETLETVEDPLDDTTATKTEDVLGGRAHESSLGVGWLGDEEQLARKVTDAQIKKYWRSKEVERKAPRVHQQDLSLHEKILREWDMSGQFGPCIGIARLKRWKRANVLGLKPPIEVLAVLLKEMDKGDTKSQRAHVDELMSSRFVADS